MPPLAFLFFVEVVPAVAVWCVPAEAGHVGSGCELITRVHQEYPGRLIHDYLLNTLHAGITLRFIGTGQCLVDELIDFLALELRVVDKRGAV